jgi:hypothetical protein
MITCISILIVYILITLIYSLCDENIVLIASDGLFLQSIPLLFLFCLYLVNSSVYVHNIMMAGVRIRAHASEECILLRIRAYYIWCCMRPHFRELAYYIGSVHIIFIPSRDQSDLYITRRFTVIALAITLIYPFFGRTIFAKIEYLREDSLTIRR